MSYRTKHVKTKVHGIKPKKSVLRRLWFWITVLVIIVVVFAAYAVIFWSELQVKNVVINGNERVNAKDLQSLVDNDSSTTMLNFWTVKISSRSILLVDKGRISSDILRSFPNVEKVKISRRLPQTLVVEISERNPLGIFCSTNSGCFLVDGEGVAFEKTTANNSDSGYPIVRQTFGDGKISAGQKVVDQYAISAISQISKTLKDNFKISLQYATIAGLSRLDIKTSEGWLANFVFGPDVDTNSQITKLELLLRDGILSDKRNNLRYINLIPKDKAEICDNAVCGG